MQIQYRGFQNKACGRDYAYTVTGGNSEPREFVFSIPTQAFMKGRVRYQEAASLCYEKLRRALEEETTQRPLPGRSTVSDEELDEYHDMHTPAKRHSSGHAQHRSNKLRTPHARAAH